MSKLSDNPELRQKSLDNLKPISSSDRARELQLKSAAKRSERRAALEALKLAAKDLEEVGSLTVLRGMLDSALNSGDNEAAYKLASTLAEYEAPKLQRQEIDQRTTVTELSDDELAAELKKLEDK